MTAFKLAGVDVPAVYVGNTPARRIYVGATRVWPATAVLASDSFNRADTSPGTLGALDYAQGGAVTGLIWQVESQMAITGNQASGPVTTTRRATVDLGVSDGYCEVEVTAVDGGVTARYVDTTAYYQFRYIQSTTTILLEEKVANVSTTVWTSDPAVFTPGPGQRLGISCHGSTIAGYINGEQVCSVTTTAEVTGTRWGLRSGANGSAFRLDNWIAKTFVS